jgi:P27 family predicted phage terminase small subunit
MARGRKPTPTALKILRGNPGKRPLPKGEVQPPPAHLTPPEWLSAPAQVHWHETAPLLHQQGLLTVLDTHAWAMACAAWERYLALSAVVDQEGMIIPTAREGWKTHPALRAAERSAELYLKIAREFGAAGPSSRVGLAMQPQEPDPLDEFLRGKKDKSRFFRRTD